MLFKVASKAIALGAKVSLNHDPRCDETGKSNETTAFSPSQPFTGEPDLLIMVTRFKNSETRRFSHDVFVDRYVNCRNIPEIRILCMPGSYYSFFLKIRPSIKTPL